jgi:hypothetical protein
MSAFLKKKGKNFSRPKKTKLQLTPLQKQLLIGFVVMCIVVLMLTAVWFITRLESLQIKNISVVGGETIPHALIEEKVNTALSGTYLALIPKRFMPLYPKQSVIENIRTVSRVKNVQVERTDDQTLTVVFDEYIPYALWCETSLSEACLFMDRAGFAFAEAPLLEGSAFIRYVDEGKMPENNTQGFDPSFVKETEQFTSLLQENLSLYVTHVHKAGTYDVEYTISGGGVIKVSQSIPMQKSFENLQTILLSDAFKHLEPGSFKYIDLRFGEKVFVNESLQEMPATTTASTSNPL